MGSIQQQTEVQKGMALRNKHHTGFVQMHRYFEGTTQSTGNRLCLELVRQQIEKLNCVESSTATTLRALVTEGKTRP